MCIHNMQHTRTNNRRAAKANELLCMKQGTLPKSKPGLPPAPEDGPGFPSSLAEALAFLPGSRHQFFLSHLHASPAHDTGGTRTRPMGVFLDTNCSQLLSPQWVSRPRTPSTLRVERTCPYSSCPCLGVMQFGGEFV